jgi:hypothetical protein
MSDRKAYDAKYYENNKEKLILRSRLYRDENKEEVNLKQKVYHSKVITIVMSMLIARIINDSKVWHIFCNKKRHNSKKYPYSEDFTDEIFFEKMKDGCVYCGDIALTVDRVDSSLDHTPNNCIGCCIPCNKSKGNADPNSFIRKAYYRARGRYFDDTKDIWSDNKTKPRFDKARKISHKQQRPFTLSQDDWNALIIGDCAYCNRSRPDNKWNGVDRINPNDGYIPDNTISCCHDCNIDKGELSEDDMRKRNGNITNRLENGTLILFDCEISLRTKNHNKKRICAYEKVYSSHGDASKALNKSDNYITACFVNKRHFDDIFEISNEFYEFAIENNLENITKKMYMLFSRM